MFRVLSCLGSEHDWRLVVLAACVCFVTSLLTVILFQRAKTSDGRARIAWIATGGVASGSGIWATHFIAMLAYDPSFPIAFDLTRTVLSYLVAIALMCIALGTAIHGTRRLFPIAGGAMAGAAIAGMHYLGMSALEVPGRMSWAPDLVVASLLLGAVFGMAALDTASRRPSIVVTSLAAFCLFAAIVSLHFTAMGAIQFVPDPTRIVLPSSISPNVLALAVAGATTIVLAICTVSSVVDQRITEKNEQFDAALQNMSQGLCLLNSNFEAVVVNRRFADMFGIPHDRVSPPISMRALMDLAEKSVPFGPDVRDAIGQWERDLVREKKSGKTIFQRTDGRAFLISHEQMPKSDGWVQTFEDITERRKAEEQITHMARHDALTDLPNRVYFHEQMARSLADIESNGAFAVLCLDLDHFKTVNDTLGHLSGDRLLQIAAKRIRAAVRDGDVVARLGGDEFAILQMSTDQPAAATGLAGRLIEAMRSPFLIDDQQMPVGLSVGVALAPNDGRDSQQLLKSADLALYRAKGDGRGTYRFFEAEMDARVQSRRAMEIDLRRALLLGQFELYFQPIINAVTEKVSSFEALLRWNHPSRGMIPPLDFIPLAEETGLIVPIGEWVLQEACMHAAKWPAHVHISVNLSPAQFKNKDLVAVVVKALDASGLAPNRLALEITETVLLLDSAVTLEMLHELRGLGVSISMDDFGTGYSSLSYLRRFPFDKIKIDQSFIRDLADHTDSLAIVRAVTGLGSSLGISTTAEGVETAEQFMRLKAEGCTEAQGYLFGAPKPFAEASRLVMGTDPLQAVA